MLDQLKAEKAELEGLFNAAELAVVLLDQSLCIKRFNPAFAKYVDVSCSDIGKELAGFSHAFSKSDFLALIRDAEAACTEEASAQHELNLRDGSWALARVRPFFSSEKNSLTGAIITVWEVSASWHLRSRRLTHHVLLQGLLEKEITGYWDRNFKRQVEYVSPQFNRVLGYEPEEAGTSIDRMDRLVHPEDRDRIQRNLAEHIESRGRIPYQQDIRFLAKDGTYQWFLRRGHISEWSEAGEPLRMLGVHIDISGIKGR